MGKYISVEQALDLVNSSDHIVVALGASEPYEFLSKLHTIAGRVKNVTVTNCLSLREYEYNTNPEYKESFFCESLFYSSPTRQAHSLGRASFIPNHLRLSGVNRRYNRSADIFVGICSPPDKHGFVSIALSNVYERRMMDDADVVVLEVNPNVPRTFGDVNVPAEQVDYFIAADYPMPEIKDPVLGERDVKIGKLIAGIVDDGDCIQLGIGSIPNAVAAALTDKKDLGVHTEMFTTGIMNLMKAGVVTGRYKQVHREKAVCSFMIGSREMYDFVDDNPAVLVLDCNYVNAPGIIARNDNQVSINTSLEVDITGQCCSESLGSRQFSGTGGQTDTAVGAQMSRNGRSIIALYSTAMVKDPVTGERKEASKIVTRLKEGAAVSLSRNDVNFVVTEYGMVDLKGASIAERAKKLISIAHPAFREQLEREAYECGIVIR